MTGTVEDLVKICEKFCSKESSKLLDCCADNTIKMELWKGCYEGKKLGLFLGSVFTNSQFEVKLFVLKLLRKIKCNSVKKNKVLFEQVIGDAGFKGAKWWKLFSENKMDYTLFLGQLYSKSSAELENGKFAFLQEELTYVDDFNCFKMINPLNITMVDIDGCVLSIYEGSRKFILKLKNNTSMNKMKKWINQKKLVNLADIVDN
eukprot:NODE_142_length_15935_cov_1.439126.p9 type:complete len:204 gc:universal NODE_142_length_15935_cov_1.439126:12845-12234(-)